ncbi:MAG: DUF4440 domain-containing protein [Gemmatimonadota bacterium]|nr:MAG: DUF4440 domain-containing protein [Gemmatimonadota bacterium]
MRQIGFLVLGAVIGLVVGAVWIGPERAGDLADEDVAAINAALESYTQDFEANDWATFVTHYAEDAVDMPPNAPSLQGTEAIREMIESWPTVTAFSTTVDEIDGSREVAFLRGGYTFSAILEGMAEPVTDTGKFVHIWRRQPDGSWLIAVEIWNSDSPPPPVPGGPGG